MSVQADWPSEDQGVPQYTRSPSEGATPSGTDNALPKDLRRAYLAIELGQNTGLSNPPVLSAQGKIGLRDGWNIYLNHVSHALWLEVHRKALWRLVDFKANDLEYLLDSRKLILTVPHSFWFSERLMGRITSWNLKPAYDFLTNYQLIGTSHEQTIYALTDWMRGQLRHWSGDYLTWTSHNQTGMI